MSTAGNWRGPDIVKNGLVLYLDPGSPNSYFDKNSTNIKDISGNNYSGSLANGPTYSSANGGTIVFDGTNDYIKTNYSTNNTYFSIELIVKPNIVSGVRVYVGKFSGAGNDWWIGGNGTTLTYSTNGSSMTFLNLAGPPKFCGIAFTNGSWYIKFGAIWNFPTE